MNIFKKDYINFVNSSLKSQIEEAQEDLRMAYQDEQYADAEHLDIAIENVQIAMSRLNVLYKRAKLESS